MHPLLGGARVGFIYNKRTDAVNDNNCTMVIRITERCREGHNER
jgi:hypothetical protein